MDVCNISNLETAKSPLILPPQTHGGGGDKVIIGTFPVTSVMNEKSNGTLTAENNTTVQATSYLEGYPEPGMGDHFKLNLIPTCRPVYTDCPTPKDYEAFRPATRALLASLYQGGAQVITAISESCRPDIEKVLHGDATPKVEVLTSKNGSTLELHMPEGKQPVLIIFPAEHMSHIAWQV